MSDFNKFKNSVGRYYLRGLFFEETGSDKSSVLFTLKREDHEGYLSLYRLYMLAADPTEYKFATSALDGWAHWQELTEADWFKPYVQSWREELSTKIQSDAWTAIMAQAKDTTNPNSYHANKYVLEALRSPADAKKRGRPTRHTSKDEITHQRSVLAEIQDDAKRLGLQ